MVLPHGIQLATHLISRFYGDLCSKVCNCLLNKGTLTLVHIIRFTEMTKENVVNCLRILIHQNCVQAFTIQEEGNFDEVPRMVTQYMVLFENIIHKLRAPKFMEIVKDELGEDCLEIFQWLTEHGRISIDQIIDRKEEIARKNKDSFDAHSVRESFQKLLNCRFIERCPAPEPYLDPLVEDRPAAKRGKSAAKVAPEKTIEQRALEAAAPMDSLRFVMEMDDLTDEKGGDNKNNVAAGKKRKQEDLNFDDADKKKVVLWRVNFEEFLCRLRHKACISQVQTSVDNEAIIVLRAILDISRRSDRRLKAKKSAELSLNAILNEIIKKEDGLVFDIDRVNMSVKQLGCETHLTDYEDSYSIDIKEIIEKARNNEVESMVLRRYGKEAYKMFRYLSMAGHFVETDKLADSTYVDRNDAIKIMYKLWKDNYLQIERSLVTGKAGAGQSVLLHCRIHQMLREKFLNQLYQAALSLRLRIAHEREQSKEVLQLPKEKLLGEMKKKFELAQRVRIVLETSLIKLDDTIMLFQDF